MPSTAPEQGHPILLSLPNGPLYLRQQIGSGGTSTVWRALLPTKPTSTFYAVKIVKTITGNPVEAKKVDREFRIHQTLRHEFVLEIVAAERREREKMGEDEWPEGLYIAMQLATGGDLFDMIGE
ncbi:hypothetical protein P7C70_g6402, partial [Phenoliferia sp. Uapishka_3]